jgi:hypothetical protein
MLSSELKQAVRLLLESATRSSRAPVAESLGSGTSRPVFVLRSAGTDVLASFFGRLSAIDPDADVYVLGRKGDSALIPRFWTGRWTCHEVNGDAPFSWGTLSADAEVCAAGRRCERHVFLMRNASAAGYDNAIEILRGLGARTFFGCLPGGVLVRFDPASLDHLLTSARLRDALVDWTASAAEPRP